MQMKRNKLAQLSLISLCVIFVFSIFAFLSPYDPNKIDIAIKFQGPSINHTFGTDELGRDYFTRALYGGRISIMVGILSMSVSIIIGTIVGAISGYVGGILDSIIMRIIDMLMCIPIFFLILIANAYLKPSIVNTIVIIGTFGWMGIARIVRSETLSYKERDYVLVAKSLGASNWYIIKTHIIPNVLPTVIVASSINIADAILTESALSFLGLGVQQPMASWGSMLQAAQARMSDKAYLAVFPGLLILITVLSFNVLGDVLRLALEPKMNDI
ncbi:ABC transporter permease [Clostridium argentinense]|nr:ABC transporter permease [Clostridium argentinense]ARC87121.1 peptide ABC transporter permease [Clostridium argentinense]NFF38560.1 ABC transporter permease [Clostridium argentinense]NFP51680.1 ABC transporter permease [Clostridium argentinense]NFP74021.1 ABC transporter permease [Clostridium argentinense]NFP77061.1 ABC transporter permease [Clostridium argentinense]